ncbi:MAG: IclR family transcriptional regulator [Oscillospiraceae bacterium]
MTNHMYATTVLKAFEILDCFDDDYEALGISEISNRIDMPPSSVHRMIQSLEFEGLLFQSKETKKYYIGTKLIALSKKCSRLTNFLQIASKYVDELARETQETVNLATPSCDKIINIYKVESHFILRPNFALNTPYPAHCTGTGRIFLSEMSDASLLWVYQNNQAEIDLPFEEFLAGLHAVKKAGFAFDDQMFNSGLRCIAAPIRAFGGKTIFAISVSAPLARMSDEAYMKAKDLVLQYAELASNEIQSME